MINESFCVKQKIQPGEGSNGRFSFFGILATCFNMFLHLFEIIKFFMSLLMAFH